MRGEGGRLRSVATRLLLSVVSCWLAGPGARSQVLGALRAPAAPPPTTTSANKPTKSPGDQAPRCCAAAKARGAKSFLKTSRPSPPMLRSSEAPRPRREQRASAGDPAEVVVRSANSLRATRRGGTPLLKAINAAARSPSRCRGVRAQCNSATADVPCRDNLTARKPSPS